MLRITRHRGRTPLITFAKKKHLIDDPGGRKARLENVYSRNHYLLPKEICTIMRRRTGFVYDIDLDMHEETGWFVRITPIIDTDADADANAIKLGRICSSLNKWGCADAVRDGIESLNGPVVSTLDIDLGMGKRWLAEFELHSGPLP
jgi:hypothetical protein